MQLHFCVSSSLNHLHVSSIQHANNPVLSSMKFEKLMIFIPKQKKTQTWSYTFISDQHLTVSLGSLKSEYFSKLEFNLGIIGSSIEIHQN